MRCWKFKRYKPWNLVEKLKWIYIKLKQWSYFRKLLCAESITLLSIELLKYWTDIPSSSTLLLFFSSLPLNYNSKAQWWQICIEVEEKSSLSFFKTISSLWNVWKKLHLNYKPRTKLAWHTLDTTWPKRVDDTMTREFTIGIIVQ